MPPTQPIRPAGLHGPRTLGLAALTTLALAACQPMTVDGTGQDRGFIPGGQYVLVGIGGGTVPQRNVTLLMEENRISGTGPCNAYSAQNTAELPAISLATLSTGTAGCAQTALENRFFSALRTATEAEYYGGVLKIKSPETWLIFETGVPLAEATDTLEVARAAQ